MTFPIQLPSIPLIRSSFKPSLAETKLAKPFDCPVQRKSIDNPLLQTFLSNLRSNRIKENFVSFRSKRNETKKGKGKSNNNRSTTLTIDPRCPNSFSKPPSFNPSIKEAYVRFSHFHSTRIYIYTYIYISRFFRFNPSPSPFPPQNRLRLPLSFSFIRVRVAIERQRERDEGAGRRGRGGRERMGMLNEDWRLGRGVQKRNRLRHGEGEAQVGREGRRKRGARM